MSSRKNRTTTKKARKRYLKIRFLSKEEKKKGNKIVMNITKMSQKIENQSLLSIEKNILD